MEIITGSEQIKKADIRTSEEFHISSDVLMERAAYECRNALLEALPKVSDVLIVSGTGNNGGDGFALGRLLHEKGIDADCVLIGKRDKCCALSDKQIKALETRGNKVLDAIPEKTYDAVVDALFGVSLNRDIEGDFKEAVDKINSLKERGAFVLSIDIASGINADTGAVMGTAVYADMTVACGYKKIGSLIYPGALYSGKVIAADIGIPRRAVENADSLTAFEPYEIHLLARYADSNKGSYGKALFVCGSKEICGAAILSAKAALKCGVGMVRIFTHELNRNAIITALPEALITTYSTDIAEDELKGRLEEALGWSSTAVIGCGLGTGNLAKSITEKFITSENVPKTVVFDADALNIIAADDEFLYKGMFAKKGGRRIIFTPHVGEMARLTGKSAQEIKADSINIARMYARRHNVTLCLKDARTVTAMSGGRSAVLNLNGNNGMATAGSGDVLSGIIAALGDAPLGVAVHGAAGDIARDAHGLHSMTASDIIEAIGKIDG